MATQTVILPAESVLSEDGSDPSSRIYQEKNLEDDQAARRQNRGCKQGVQDHLSQLRTVGSRLIFSTAIVTVPAQIRGDGITGISGGKLKCI